MDCTRATARETDYELVVRCQLVTTFSKTDSVIARAPGGLVFLKGPYRTSSPVLQFIHLQKLKQERGIPAVAARLIFLIPDRWKSTPLGLRNRLDLSQPHAFMECDLLFSEPIETEFKESKLWPRTEVLDCKAMKLTIDPFSLNATQLAEYVAAIKFRLEYKLGDFADRNFILGKDGHIYSVDEEEVSERPIDLKKQLKKRRYELVEPYL